RIGAQSAFATPPVVLIPWPPSTPEAFLKAATIKLPVPPVNSGAPQTSNLTHPFLLDSTTIVAEEKPVDVPGLLLTATNYPLLAGAPVVTVESVSPGIQSTVTVRAGVACDRGAGASALRAAF